MRSAPFVVRKVGNVPAGSQYSVKERSKDEVCSVEMRAWVTRGLKACFPYEGASV